MINTNKIINNILGKKTQKRKVRQTIPYKFNPDGSLKIPERRIPERQPSKKRDFWQKWLDKDIYFVYIIPNDKLLDEVKKDHVRDKMIDGMTESEARDDFDSGIYDIVEAFSDLRIVVAKTDNGAKEVAWKNFNEGKQRNKYKMFVESAISKIGQTGDELKRQFVFDGETREADLPFHVKESLVKYKIRQVI